MGRSTDRIIPSWTEDVGALRYAGAEVYAICTRCASHDSVDLAAVETRQGPFFSFWNRHPRCPARCGTRLLYHAMIPKSGAWRCLMHHDDAHQVAALHRPWRAERERRIREARFESLLLKHRRRRRELRREALEMIAVEGLGALATATSMCRQDSYNEIALERDLLLRAEISRQLEKRRRVDLKGDV